MSMILKSYPVSSLHDVVFLTSISFHLEYVDELVVSDTHVADIPDNTVLQLDGEHYQFVHSGDEWENPVILQVNQGGLNKQFITLVFTVAIKFNKQDNYVQYNYTWSDPGGMVTTKNREIVVDGETRYLCVGGDTFQYSASSGVVNSISVNDMFIWLDSQRIGSTITG